MPQKKKRERERESSWWGRGRGRGEEITTTINSLGSINMDGTESLTKRKKLKGTPRLFADGGEMGWNGG